MQKVSSIISSAIGDTLTNMQTWKNVMYNVLENGLYGDGTTDDTAALQTLVNTAIAAGRRTIFFPHTDTGGEYYVTALTDADQVDFVGDNSSFVGGYTGTITNFGGLAALESQTVTGIINIVTAYGADPTGATDCTSAIQAAITAAGLAGGGVIFFPNGRYRVDGNLTMEYGVHLIGVSQSSTIVPGTGLSQIKTGSVLEFTDTIDPAITYTSGNHFEGLTFYYPNQVTVGTPTAYPATFAPDRSDPSEIIIRVNFHNLTYVNAYYFIDATKGHLDFEFYNLVGCSISKGINIDGCGGTDILKNIRDSYFYYIQYSSTLQTWMQANAQGLSVGRCDAIHGERLYFGSKNVGVRLYKGVENVTTGCYGSIVGLSLDGNNYGLYVEETHEIGVDIVDMMCNSITFDIEVQSGTTTAALQISNSKFWGAKGRIIRMNGTAFIDISGSTFFSATSESILVAGSGCRLKVCGCQFRDTLVRPVNATATLAEFVFQGNSIPAIPVMFSPIATTTIIKENTYLEVTAGSVASASTITLPINTRVTITGNTQINTMNGGWAGREVLLLIDNAGLVFSNSGNIVKSLSPAQYTLVRAFYTGSAWLIE